MRKLSIMILALFLGYFSDAQTEAGGWFAGSGSQFSYSSSKSSGVAEATTNLRLQAQFGNFVADNFNLGLLLGIDNTKQGDSKLNTSLIGPYLRYYANSQFFMEIGYLFGNSEANIGGGNASISGEFLTIGAGVPIWIKDDISVEPSLSYSSGRGAYDGDNTLVIGVGFGLYF